jgi:hypothetical protein
MVAGRLAGADEGGGVNSSHLASPIFGLSALRSRCNVRTNETTIAKDGVKGRV